MASLISGIGHSLWRLTLGNPILLAVVSQSSRRTLQTWLRTGYVGLLILVSLVMLVGAQTSAGQSMSRLGQAGERMFTTIALLQLVLICLLAPVFAAGAVSQQKDSRTFHVLLSTPLTNGQIVLGSLMSRVFIIWALLAGGLPILAVTRVFGRVANSQIFLATGIAAATALVTGAVAVAWSVLVAGTRRSLLLFYSVIFAYLVAVPALGQLPIFQLPASAGTAVGYSGNVNWLTPIHPISILTVLRGTSETLGDSTRWEPPSAELVRQMGYGSPWDWYLSSPAEAYIAISTIISLLLIAPAVLLLRTEAVAFGAEGRREPAAWLVSLQAALSIPGTWLRTVALGAFSSSRADAGRRRLAELKQELGGKRIRRIRSVWNNPVAWREASTRAGAGGRGTAKWLFAVVGAVIAIALAIRRAQMPDPPRNLDDLRFILQWVLVLEFVVILGVVLNGAASSIAKERESETFDVLLTTPITPPYYVWGKLRGLVSFVLPMTLVPGFTILAMCAGDLVAAWNTGTYHPTVLPEAAIELPILMTVFASAAAVVALRISLSSRKITGAVIKSVLATAAVLLPAMGCLGNAMKRDDVWGVVSTLSPIDAVHNCADPWNRFPLAIAKGEKAGLAPEKSEVVEDDEADTYSGPRRGRAGGAGFSNRGAAARHDPGLLRSMLLLMTLITAAAYVPAIYAGYRSIVNNFQAHIRKQQG